MDWDYLTHFMVNSVLIPVAREWPASNLSCFKRHGAQMTQILWMTVFENDDYEYLIEIEAVPKSLNENGYVISKTLAIRIKPVIPGYDFEMDYPGKDQNLETWAQVTETVNYLLLNMKTAADKYAGLIDEAERQNPL